MTYHMVEDSLWSDDKIVRAPNEAKQVFFYLLTGPSTNMTGCFCVRLMTIVDALYGVELSNEALLPKLIGSVKAGISHLEREGVIRRCEETGWTWLVNHLKHRPIPNPKAGISAMRLISKIPQSLPFYQELIKSYRIHAVESSTRVASKDNVLDLRQIDALIQSFRSRYSIDTPTRVGGSGQGNPEPIKNGAISGSESDLENQQVADPYPIQHSNSNSNSTKEESPSDLFTDNLITLPDPFEEWWLCWAPGTKKGREDALKSYALIIRNKKATHEQLCDGVRAYMRDCEARRTDRKYIAHPASWLNAGRWADEYDAPETTRKRFNGVI